MRSSDLDSYANVGRTRPDAPNPASQMIES